MGLDNARQIFQVAASIQEAVREFGLSHSATFHAKADILIAKPSSEMDEDDIKSIKEQISRYKRRLNILKNIKATYGIDCSPQILIEIDDIEHTVKELKNKLREVNI